ncbi:MAG TPA: hypothetical protein VH437_17540 [Terriglobales bacterium]|jgi:Rod binding domain-containing protein
MDRGAILHVPRGDPSAADAREKYRIEKAARDFETILVGTLLRDLDFSLPSDGEGAGEENYRYLGTQALVSGLVESGGLGIARLIKDNLLKTQDHRDLGTGPIRPKVSPFHDDR